MALTISAPAAVSALTRQQRLRAVDLLLLVYLAVVSAVAIERGHIAPGAWWLVGAHTLFLGFLALITRPGLGPVGQLIREIYPLILLVALYSELDVLNGSGRIPSHDLLVQHWELLLFGGQVSREWWQSTPSRFWSTVLHGAYFGYYFIIVVPAFYFAWRGELRALRGFVLTVMTTFVLCYLCFIFFPVAGPYYVFPRPPDWFTANPAAQLVYSTLAAGSSYGAAFPSSHVAATVAALVASWRGSRRVGELLLLPTILLTIGVVYCQMHYAVDALAGLLVGVGVAVATGGYENGAGS